MITTSNLAVRFALELAGLAALAYAGLLAVTGPLRWLAAIAAPLALTVPWGLLIAPHASNPLAPWLRELLGSAALLVTAGALALAGRPGVAAGFAVLVIVNQVLLVVLREQAGPGWAR